eukprot:symbB.v1.2.024930.t1/scaffold2297.1/size187394/2
MAIRDCGLENVDEYNTGQSSKIAAQSTSSWQRQSSLESSKVGDDAKLDRSVTSVSFKEDDVLHLFRKFDANRPGSDSLSRFFEDVECSCQGRQRQPRGVARRVATAVRSS